MRANVRRWINAAVSSRRRHSALKQRRAIWVKVHLWLGLVLGVVLAITGITGSLLVFHHEIDEVLNPTLLTVQPHARGIKDYRPIDEILASAQAALPGGSKVRMIYGPRNDAAVFSLTALVPVGGQVQVNRDWETWNVLINPYDAKVIGSRLVNAAGWSHFLPRTFIGFVFILHYALLLPNIGGTIVGICSVLLCFSVLSGLILWWPLDGNWRRVFSIEPHRSRVRLNHDIHQTLAFWSALVLLAVLISGIYMVLPTQFMALLQQFSPDSVWRYGVQSIPNPGAKLLSPGQATRRVTEKYPDGRLSLLYPPSKKRQSYMLCYKETESRSLFVNRRCVVVDQYTGDILHVEEVGSGTAGVTFIAWQWPLHSGVAFGWPGRILIFLCGLACPVIFVTGLIRWKQKRRARSLNQQRRALLANERA